MPYERHDLLHLTHSGRKRLAEAFMSKGFEKDFVSMLLLPEEGGEFSTPVPGIVRREESSPCPGQIPAGFVSWKSGAFGRLRIGSFVLPEEVDFMTSPEATVESFAALHEKQRQRTPAMSALDGLRFSLAGLPFRLGVWGSAALEVVTGRAYTHEFSDLDIRLRPEGRVIRADLEECMDAVLGWEKNLNIRIDAELRTNDAYGVSLKELLGAGMTVLGKGQDDVALLKKHEVFKSLSE